MAILVVTCPQCKVEHSFDGLLPFRAECDKCSADLHVCINCKSYDRYAENECREDQAEYVSVKDRRNLCEYWKPKDDSGVDDAQATAKAKLDALFKKPGGPAPSLSAPSPTSPASSADEAKRKLEALFKKKP